MTGGNGYRRLTGRELFKAITKRLKSGGIENSAGEAGFILSQVTGRAFPLAMTDGDVLSEGAVNEAIEICRRRTAGEPLQYILGEWDFYGMTFKVGKGVLIPRQDTEILAEEAIRSRERTDSTNYADLCSGSGCVAAAVARYVKGIKGYAIEKSPEAFEYLRENISQLAPSVTPCLDDVLLPETAAKYTSLDLITANPPYLTEQDMNELQKEVSFEPELALFGGKDGLMFYRELTRIWKGSLKKDGMLLFEVGIGQYEDVMNILRENGFAEVDFSCDLSGIERVVMGRKP